MPRSPLFREEERNFQQRRTNKDVVTHSEQKYVNKKIDKQQDALWNRMHVAMRLSCQHSKSPPKR